MSNLDRATRHPLPSGHVFFSPGGHFTYRVVGPCCQLFDREELPWPCCRIQWRTKEPSWRRVGRRFVADIAAKRCPSYSVEVLNAEYSQEPTTLTLYWIRLESQTRDWWYSKVRSDSSAMGMNPPV
ncbi:MAG: hypothetical protein WBA57_07335 [Elainellaceae cyanobacterium]